MPPHDEYERAHAGPVAGVDEVGRGVLAGPVVAAAVILDLDDVPNGLNDSKQLSATSRESLYASLTQHPRIYWSVAEASVEEVDRHNIYHASLLAMTRAIHALPVAPALALIDGNATPKDLRCQTQCVIKGDATCLSIAAASIIAKVTRDRMMHALAAHYPGYGWESNVGYSTAAHLAALRQLGVTPLHRRSFRPVYEQLHQTELCLVAS
jgi:ribonuclease HII